MITPENTVARMVAMAIERGKLADLIFEDPERLSHRVVAQVIKLIERAPTTKALLAIRPLRSRFLQAVVAAAGPVP